MIPGDRLICAFVAPVEISFKFKQWLLHVTVVPWFRLQEDSEQIANELHARLSGIRPFEVIMDGYATFGRGKTVSLARTPTPLQDVESLVRRYFHKKTAWLVDETTRKRHSYRPHVTAQKDAQLKSGDTWKCDKLYIIEQRGDYKEVVGIVKLGNETAS